MALGETSALSPAVRLNEIRFSSTPQILPSMPNATRLSVIALALLLSAGTAGAQSSPATPAETAKPAAPDVVLPLPAADRDKYVGTYTLAASSGEIMTVKIWAEGSELVAQANENEKNPLRYLGGATFRVDNIDQPTRVTFLVENGHATSGTVVQSGAIMTLTLVK
jgi:hypothetical protein